MAKLIIKQDDFDKEIFIKVPKNISHEEFAELIFQNSQIKNYLAYFEDNFGYTLDYRLYRLPLFSKTQICKIAISIYKIIT